MRPGPGPQGRWERGLLGCGLGDSDPAGRGGGQHTQGYAGLWGGAQPEMEAGVVRWAGASPVGPTGRAAGQPRGPGQTPGPLHRFLTSHSEQGWGTQAWKAELGAHRHPRQLGEAPPQPTVGLHTPCGQQALGGRGFESPQDLQRQERPGRQAPRSPSDQTDFSASRGPRLCAHTTPHLHHQGPGAHPAGTEWGHLAAPQPCPNPLLRAPSAPPPPVPLALQGPSPNYLQLENRLILSPPQERGSHVRGCAALAGVCGLLTWGRGGVSLRS